MKPKLLVLLKRKPGLGAEQFRRDYAGRHVALAWSKLPASVAAGVERYAQSHARATDSAPYDCVTEIVFRDAESLAAWSRWYRSPAADELRADEEQLIDVGRRLVLVTEEVATPQPGPRGSRQTL